MKSFKFIHSVFILSTISFIAVGQNGKVKGSIKDADTKIGLPKASVLFDDARFSTLTDTSGNFQISLKNGDHTVVVRYVGYKTYRTKFTLKDNLVLDLELKNNDTELESVEVKGSTKSNSKNLSIGMNALDIKGIKKLPAILGEVDVLRSLLTLPGVSSVGEGANGLNIRGGNVDQNLIYVDDAPIFNPTHMFGLFSVFPADAISGLELYKGGVPARYGGRVSSVLDIKMLEPSQEKFKLLAGIGPVSNRLTTEIPLVKNKLSLLSSGRLSYNDFWLRWLGGPSISGTKANFFDVTNKIVFKPGKKTKIVYSQYVSVDNYGVDSLFSIENVVTNNTNFRYGHNNNSIKLSHLVNSKLSLNLTGVSSIYSTNTFSKDSVTAFELKTRLKYMNIKLNADYTLNKRNQLNFGLSGIKHIINPGDFNKDILSTFRKVEIQQEQSYELAGYISDEIKISEKIGLDVGVRYVQFLNVGPFETNEYLDNEPRSLESISKKISLASGETESQYAGFEPRGVIKYSFPNEDAIKLGYNRMQQFIQLVSNNTTPLPTSRWKTTDRFTPPQRSNFYSAGYFKNTEKDKYSLSAEAYFRTTENFIVINSSANLQLNPNLETQLLSGNGRAYGLELMLTKNLGETTGWFSYTFARAFQKIKSEFPEQLINDGNWFPADFDKPHTITSTVTSKINQHHAFTWNFAYSTGRPYNIPAGSYELNRLQIPIYVNRNNGRIADYHRLDFSWTITNPRMRKNIAEGSWVFTVYNLYGRKNAYSYFFRPRPYGLELNKLSVFASPFLSLMYNFTINGK